MSATVVALAPVAPSLIIVDTSVLLQVIATEQLGCLRGLRSCFGIQSAIVDAVHSEASTILKTVPRFMGRQEQLKRACTNGTLPVVSRDWMMASYGGTGSALLQQINAKGEELAGHVDRGEAYSHAASACLDSLIATNDTNAVNVLIRMKEFVPRPVLRFWDLMVLAFQSDLLTAAECDKVRQTLAKLNERTDPAFKGRPFMEGLSNFYPRIVDGTKDPVGAREPQERMDFRLPIHRLTAAPAI